MMTMLELFWSFVQVGTFSVGGGYAALPLISDQVVTLHGWMTMNEFSDVVTLSQMTPGPIAINAATFVGMRVGGIVGAVVATVGCVLPCALISLLLAYAYYKFRKGTLVKNVMDFLRPASVALIAYAGLTITAGALWGGSLAQFSFQAIDIVAVILFAAALVAVIKFKVTPIPVIVGTGVVGLIVYLLTGTS